MSLNEPLDFKSQPKKGRSESERTAKKHDKNKRQKSKRAASPTSSYLSMMTDWSIDPPTNFKDGETFPLQSRIKRKRETSPVTSYISLKSDNLMNVSEGNDSDLRVRAASPTPTYLSLKTDWSIDPPTNFKTEETFPLDPRKSSETRPVLNTNAALAEVVKNMQQAGFSPALPPQSYAGPEDMACDLCSERRLKSVKCCTTCGVSLCETHVRQHYTVPALQKHTLCDVTGDIKTRPSQQLQTSDNSFNSTAGGHQHHIDKTQDIIKCSEISDAPEATTPVMDEPEPTAGTEPDPAMIPAAVKKETETGIVLEPETETGIILEPETETGIILEPETETRIVLEPETGIVPEPEPKDKSNQETAVTTKLQTRLKRSAKTFRPKTKEKKDNVKSLALICSTLQQEVSGLKEKLSKLESKNTKTEKYEDEEDYEYDKEEEDDEEEDYDYGDEDKEEEDVEEEDEEYEKEDYGDDNEDYSEKDFHAESDEEEEDDEDRFDDEDGYKDDYDWEEDDWKENEDDLYDDDNSEEDSDEDLYDDNDY